MLTIWVILAWVSFILLSGYTIVIASKTSQKYVALFAWIWFNVFIAIYETYVVIFSRSKLPAQLHKCEERPFWSGNSRKNEVLLNAWVDYACHADRRYFETSNFVHWVEFGNALIVLLLVLAFIGKVMWLVYLLLLVQAYHCFIYFLSLIHYQSNEGKRVNVNVNRYKEVIYLLISALWVIIPIALILHNYSTEMQ